MTDMRRMKCAAHEQRTNAESVPEKRPLAAGTAAKSECIRQGAYTGSYAA